MQGCMCITLQSKWSKVENEKIPAVYSIGLGYDASEKFTTFAEVQKVIGENIGVNAGLQYKIRDYLLVRSGFTSATDSYYIGFGVHIKNLRLDATASLHPQLGFTPGLLLIFGPKKQQP